MRMLKRTGKALLSASRTALGPTSGIVTAAANDGAGSVSITTSAAHGRSTSQSVLLAGVTDGGVANYDGTWVITVTGATTFTLNGSSYAGDVGSVGGTWQLV